MLEECGSGHDPVTYKGKDTDPSAIRYDPDMSPTTRARDIRLSYFGGPPRQFESRWIRGGTLLAMVINRIELQHMSNEKVAAVLDDMVYLSTEYRETLQSIEDVSR